MKRQEFLLAGFGLFTGSSIVPPFNWLSKKQDPKPLNKEMVQEFVGKSHGDFEVVKKMLTKNPELIHACNDWGGGDFENGLEAASHVGHRPIAEYLLAHGARINIFTLTMLGDLDIVKSMLQKYPYLLQAKGPHGLDLLHHARVGGKPAKAVLTFLEEQED